MINSFERRRQAALHGHKGLMAVRDLLEILRDVVRLLTFQLRDPDCRGQRRDQQRHDQRGGRQNRRRRR